jgi:hypothetical protein
MTSRRSALPPLVLAVALAACGGDAGTAIDPDALDERLFQEGLALYGQLMSAPAAAKFDELVAAYPASPRHDNAGYLAGRCAYELADYAGDRGPDRDARGPRRLLFLDEAAYYTGRARSGRSDYLGSGRLPARRSPPIPPAPTSTTRSTSRPRRLRALDYPTAATEPAKVEILPADEPRQRATTWAARCSRPARTPSAPARSAGCR